MRYYDTQSDELVGAFDPHTTITHWETQSRHVLPDADFTEIIQEVTAVETFYSNDFSLCTHKGSKLTQKHRQHCNH